MKKIILGLTFLLICGSAQASTYYVRGDGGSSSECSGLTDASKSADKNCAYNHVFWVLPPSGNNPTLFKGGDTLIIDGEQMIGWGAPNTGGTPGCSAQWAYDCFPRPIPSGTTSQPTKILGKGWDTGCANPPQFWGTERVQRILNLQGSSNVEVQCLELTDHSDCLMIGPDSGSRCQRDASPFGQWAETGIEAADSQNVLIKNVNIHGLFRGLHAGRLKDWTIEKSKINNNSYVGWDGDVGANNSSNSGEMKFIETQIKYSGCGETYPGPGLKPYNCYSQDQGGYGDGLGTHATSGNWTFINSDISNNVSDGIDLLYHTGNGSITITGGKYENNAGNQIKTGGKPVTINGVTITGNCAWFRENPQFVWNSSTFNNCRAQGDALVIAMPTGLKASIYNTKFNKIKAIAILTAGSNCNGSEAISADNATTFDILPDGHKYYASGSNGNGAGQCGQIGLTGGGTIPPPIDPPQIPDDIIPPVITGVDAKTDLKTAIVTWDLNERGTGQVEYGLTTAYGLTSVLESSFDYSRHSQNLSGLTPGTRYNFRVKSKDHAGNLSTSSNFEFATLPISCVTDNSCANLTAACDETKTCTDNCGAVFTKVGLPCPACIPNMCDALCGEAGKDNCGDVCLGERCPEPTECSVQIKTVNCANVTVVPIP